jgi:hypothetical protein
MVRFVKKFLRFLLRRSEMLFNLVVCIAGNDSRRAIGEFALPPQPTKTALDFPAIVDRLKNLARQLAPCGKAYPRV